MRFEIKKSLCSQSERVKNVEFHTELPWVLAAMYSGNITIYDYSNQQTVKTIEISNTPCRCAKFLIRKQWIISASDDLQIRVFNYNTTEKIKTFEAHTDYIRHILVHPTQPFILTSSDDTTIKVWDFEHNFNCINTFTDHSHYVMQLCFNPKDDQVFASASLDKTLKIWNLNSKKKCLFTLQGHLNGVNCLDYYKGDKPYLISGGDDRLVKIWDFQIKQCLHTLEGHQNNITVVYFHPDFSIILTGSEDGNVVFWNSNTYKKEHTFSNNMDRAWSIDTVKDNSNIIAIGYDEGTVVIKIGSDEPVVSMNNGKLIMAKNMEIFTANLKLINTNDNDVIKDGQVIDVNQKELGVSEIYPIAIKHSPNGHLFSINSDSEYVIYRTQSFKNQGFGAGMDVVWAFNGDFAYRDQNNVSFVKSQNNQEYLNFQTDFKIDELIGGPLLCAKNQEFLIFYEWQSGQFIAKIDIAAKKVYWNDSHTELAVLTNEDFFILYYDKENVKIQVQQQNFDPDEGIQTAFNLQYQIHEIVTSGIWISDVFFFINTQGKINYTLNGKVFNYNFTDKNKFIMGYVSTQNKLYLIDKNNQIISYELPQSFCEFLICAMDDNFDLTQALIKDIPQSYHDKLAKFLDQINQKAEALKLVQDEELKFDLALQLGKIDLCLEIANKQQNINKLKQIGDAALLIGQIQLAIQCFKDSEDFGSLLLIYSSLGMRDQLRELANQCDSSKSNIQFTSYFILGDLQNCIEVLLQQGKFAEAAIFSKTYYPSRVQELTQRWKDELLKQGYLVNSQKISDPFSFDEFQQDLQLGIQIENYQLECRQDVPSHQFEEYQLLMNQNLFQLLQDENIEIENLNTQIEIIDQNACLNEIHHS